MRRGNVIPFRPLRRVPLRQRDDWLTIYCGYWGESLNRLAAYARQLNQGDSAVPGLNLLAPKDEPIITGAEPRVFDAPRALVWKCFSQPEHIARWWGPRSLGQLTVKQFDFRVGGTWRFEHALKRGPVIAFKGTYRVIEPVSKLVNTFGVEGMHGGAELEETHLLEEKDGKTLYTSVLRFDDFESRDRMIASGMEAGALESMAQLDELLAELQAETVK